MNKEKAAIIARDFLETMNPSNWNGVGSPPASFNTKIKTYDIESNLVELDISFDYDPWEKRWEHYCELRDKASGDMVMPLHGCGVNSIEEIIDTILHICVWDLCLVN